MTTINHPILARQVSVKMISPVQAWFVDNKSISEKDFNDMLVHRRIRDDIRKDSPDLADIGEEF